MDFQEIQQLIQTFKQSKIRELKIDDSNFHIHLSKNEYGKREEDLFQNKPEEISENEKKATRLIKAPIVGTIYLAPSPTSEPFVKIGNQINIGDTVCVIESMKIMTEIKSDVAGIIEEINVKNGELIEVDQPLFTILSKEAN
ncbi:MULTISPECIES: acetyl-CoA carboxylase biotin carboxyl carrier protein [Limosilactobacillus]|uniref:Biotin carboxyl carrier protein of acetyl-CoA carboxylase n=1 Tax=Limosilactobacillus reuteri TaxID=1598 RepID=A0AAX2SQ18_LIMRT|nr:MULTISPECIES: biotin/lipoyl-containing protein [Limosilactobacillus]MBB1110737.1 acetyl-CoA carboxylase, biotin carboxyl carrier protein [Limosilactobacillus balticus]RMX26249.1 acetyl-CoA carboxylase, biotin carboxyl carrier protein [Limosilactobacillus reuteri]TGB10639.1 acetyl-CoA carboxylase, biotin carboxyl carrier protein [Limosilactobacillus reuteri]